MSNLFKTKQTTNTDQYQSGTSNTNLSKTSNPIVPDWVLKPFQDAAGTVGGLGSLDPSKLAPGPDPLQTLAGANAAGLTGSPWNFDTAADQTRSIMGADAPHTGAVQAKGYINDYMDPYLGSVVDTTLSDFDKNAGTTRAQQSLDLADSGAFGGSGAALTQSMTEDNLARARAAADANLRSAGFTQALGAAQSDANRKQGANDLNAQLYGQQMDRSGAMAKQLADLSSQFGADQRSNATTQAGIGDALRQITEAQGQAPYLQADTIASILSKLGLDKFIGEDTKGTTDTTSSGHSYGTTDQTARGSPMDMISQIAQIAAMFMA